MIDPQEAVAAVDLQAVLSAGHNREVEDRVRRLRIEAEARRAYNFESYRYPPSEVSSSLGTDLTRPVEKHPHRIESLLGLRHNASLTAQYKTGKTSLMLNMALALVDHAPFLGSLAVHGDVGINVGMWSGEMDRDDYIAYVRPMGVQNVDAFHTAHLRGYPVAILDDAGRQWAIDWLKEREIDVWLFDSWARLCAWNGVLENDNSSVAQLTAAVDQIKEEAGVSNFVTAVHTGRTQQAEGEERARGATALDDWVDSRIVMTRQKADRFLFCEGRNVGLEERQLSYDPATHLMSLGEGDRRESRDSNARSLVVAAVAVSPGITTNNLRELVRQDLPSKNNNEAGDAIHAAIAAGLIRTEPGPRNSKLHYLANEETEEMQWS